ncbi:phenylalanyl-tRNA synthetase alpha chain [Cryptococcus neoformans]|nr:phenylalanyl-tRNA synthetase alpha chain [Cryptococcus neoformans var. grubii]
MQKTLDEAGVPDKAGWAFGLGLERLAMVLFSIPDIRLFWTTDQRFHSQFSHGQITTFKPYSRYPECYKDMSFWLPVGSLGSLGSLGAGAEGGDAAAGVSAAGGKGRVFHENDYFEIVREVAGDLVETVSLIDEFTHPKTNRQSRCYRLNYRHMDRSLSNEEVNALQEEVQKRVVQEMRVEMR